MSQDIYLKPQIDHQFKDDKMQKFAKETPWTFKKAFQKVLMKIGSHGSKETMLFEDVMQENWNK